MAFTEHFYYRGKRGYGSPPLGVRTGLMAFALIPLTWATAGKVNIITFLTGIGHEKLNVFHRWTAYLVLYLSIIHTVPFIYQPLHEGGSAMMAATVLCTCFSGIFWDSSFCHVGWPRNAVYPLDSQTRLRAFCSTARYSSYHLFRLVFLARCPLWRLLELPLGYFGCFRLPDFCQMVRQGERFPAGARGGSSQHL